MPEPQYREFHPGVPLAGVVERVWMLSCEAAQSIGGAPAGPAAIQRIPPDGTVELILHLHNPFCQITNGIAATQPRAIVVGVWTRPIELLAPNRYDTVGIRIRPGAAPALWREPARAFADTVVDAEAVWGNAAGELQNRLLDAPDTAARLTAITTFLSRRLRSHRAAAADSVAAIAATRGTMPIDALADAASMSSRQLERVFLNEVGVSPKTFSRIVRFQHALARSTRSLTLDGHLAGEQWIEIAGACGYADQSHLIRDFVRFAGETPTGLRESAGTVADYFRRR